MCHVSCNNGKMYERMPILLCFRDKISIEVKYIKNIQFQANSHGQNMW